MIHNLAINNILKVNILLFTDPFNVKTKRFLVSVLTPAFFKKSFLHSWIASKTNEHFLFWLYFCLLFPKCEIWDILKGFLDDFSFWNRRRFLGFFLNLLLFLLSFILRNLVWARRSWPIFNVRQLELFKVNLMSNPLMVPFSSMRHFSFCHLWRLLRRFLWNFNKLWRNDRVCLHKPLDGVIMLINIIYFLRTYRNSSWSLHIYRNLGIVSVLKFYNSLFLHFSLSWIFIYQRLSVWSVDS